MGAIDRCSRISGQDSTAARAPWAQSVYGRSALGLHSGPAMATPHGRSFALAVVLASLACSSSGDAPADAAAAAPPPAAPSTGAPIAFEVTKLTPGADHSGKIAIKAYNFVDKTIAGYTIAARFEDSGGAILKVGVGTPFEADFAWTSMSGKKFSCKPKSWCTFDIEGLEVPAAATEAQVVLTSARALASDGITFEEPELWQSKDGFGKWPSDVK